MAGQLPRQRNPWILVWRSCNVLPMGYRPGVVLVVLALGLAACVGPGDVEVDDPVGAVADARRLIEEKHADPERHDGWLEARELPSSLRLPGLNYANVHADHVDLVLVRGPDVAVGARIWSRDAHRTHADEPTAYPDIYFYRYSEDLPEAPENIF